MGKMKQVNIRNARLCAFCRHWYDSTNSAIQPMNPRSVYWEYDPQAEQMCMEKNRKRRGFEACWKYKCCYHDDSMYYAVVLI
ncbi:MAG: hypothetical protein IJ801_03590 [Lachnospiraceae bacterium]|nr:hypothetical protein [Lachnospiraceae bacterium]